MRVWLDEGAYPPERAHEGDAGMDLRTPRCAVVPARGSCTIDTGVHVEIPHGFAGFLKSKSGLNVKHGITSEGVIDSGYQGSIVVKLYNNSDQPHSFEAGDKVTQLVVMRVELPQIRVYDGPSVKTARGSNGFGSTGK